jgi:hypothetical protein
VAQQNGNGHAVWPPEWVKRIHLAATSMLPHGFCGSVELNFFDCGPTNANVKFSVKAKEDVGIYAKR